MADGTTTSERKSLPFYTRTAIAGLLIYGLILLLFAALAAASGGLDTEVAVFLAVILIPTFVFVGLAWRFGKRLVLAAAIWALLNLLVNGPFVLPSLLHVNSFFDFGLGVPIIVALVVASVAGITAFVQHRRGTARTVSTPRERTVFAAITVAVVALMALSGVLHIAGLTSVDSAEKAAAISVQMKNTEFKPTEVQVFSEEPTKLVVKNGDFGVHTFTIEELDIDVTIIGGSEKLIKLAGIAAGTYEYMCTIPGHDDMKGTLKVAS